jgi:adenosyl cobinamide kinase/adenosyl cobinamide phosphate guanylyltransferase
MNLENIGLGVCKIINSNNKSEKVISVEHDKEKVDNYFEEYVCKKGEHIQLIPIKERERDVLYITGQSGSGKSTYARKFIEEYHKLYKKRPIYVFSYFQKDPSLDSLKYIKRIKLNDKFVTTDIELSDFKNSCVLFDDIDTIRCKPIRNKLMNILHSLLELGRHENVEVLYLSHIGCKGDESKSILNEMGSITIFPKIMNNRSCKYLLESYMGMDKHQIKKLKNLPSRAITIVKTYPNLVMYETGVYVLKND